MNPETMNYTLENFTKETGKRFRMTRDQTARVQLTELSQEDRENVARMDIDTAASFFNAYSKDGSPKGWVEKAIGFAKEWSIELHLTREEAFQNFIESGGLERLRGDNQRAELPIEIWQDPKLTLENFTQKALALTGNKHIFRISKAQRERGLSRQEAFNEIKEKNKS